jgi:hypothetical protein
MTRSARVERRAAGGAPMAVGHVRIDPERGEVAGIVALVRAKVMRRVASNRSSAIASAARRSAVPPACSTWKSIQMLLRFFVRALAE